MNGLMAALEAVHSGEVSDGGEQATVVVVRDVAGDEDACFLEVGGGPDLVNAR